MLVYCVVFAGCYVCALFWLLRFWIWLWGLCLYCLLLFILLLVYCYVLGCLFGCDVFVCDCCLVLVCGFWLVLLFLLLYLLYAYCCFVCLGCLCYYGVGLVVCGVVIWLFAKFCVLWLVCWFGLGSLACFSDIWLVILWFGWVLRLLLMIYLVMMFGGCLGCLIGFVNSVASLYFRCFKVWPVGVGFSWFTCFCFVIWCCGICWLLIVVWLGIGVWCAILMLIMFYLCRLNVFGLFDWYCWFD